MKIVYVSPYQEAVDILDFDLHVVRGVPFNVTDTQGALLIKHPHFEEYQFPKAEVVPETPPSSPETERVE